MEKELTFRGMSREFHKNRILRVMKDRRELLGKAAKDRLRKGWEKSLEFQVTWALLSFEWRLLGGGELAKGYNYGSLSCPPVFPDTVIMSFLKSGSMECSTNEVLSLPWAPELFSAF